jgi:hypothetical protein
LTGRARVAGLRRRRGELGGNAIDYLTAARFVLVLTWIVTNQQPCDESAASSFRIELAKATVSDQGKLLRR